MIKTYQVYASFDDCIKTEIGSDHDHTEYVLYGTFKMKNNIGSCCEFEQYIAKSDDVDELRIWADLHGLDIKKERIQ